MTLEVKDHGGNNYRKKITECPYCGAEIKDGSAFRNHLPCEEVDA